MILLGVWAFYQFKIYDLRYLIDFHSDEEDHIDRELANLKQKQII
jgi:hypothetical protein